jgi:hypothetical protein
MGAENLQSVSEDNAVSLTELKDACFFDQQSFACGDGFVIGESKPCEWAEPRMNDVVGPVSQYNKAITSAAKSCLSEIKSQGLQEDGSSPLKSIDVDAKVSIESPEIGVIQVCDGLNNQLKDTLQKTSVTSIC